MVLVLDAAIAVAGVSVAHGWGLLGLLAAGPLLACARCGGRATALVGVYAIAFHAGLGMGTTPTPQTLIAISEATKVGS